MVVVFRIEEFEIIARRGGVYSREGRIIMWHCGNLSKGLL